MTDQVEILHQSALTHAQNNNMSKAIEDFKRALVLAPREPYLHNNIANAYKKIQQWEEALFHYRQALHYRPDYAAASHNMATIFASKGDTQQALKYYRQAIHAAPDFIAAHYHLGLLLLQMKHYDAAQKQFQNVLSLQPDDTKAHFYLGILALDKQELETAAKAFQSVLEQHPEHIDALVNCGVIALKRNQGQLAIDYFTKALALDNDNLNARHNIAATFIHHDRFENALAHYDILLTQAPQEPEYLYNAGVAQMALGHLSQAQIHFETLLAVQNQHVAGLVNLAAIHIRQNQHHTAIPLLQKAAHLQPEDESIRFMLQALTQEQISGKPCSSYVSNLFNNYASYYDNHMQNTLNYKIPHQIGRLLHQLQCIQVKNTIDLGCGTGLCGIILREPSEYLVGVDIAEKMINEARQKEIYDALHNAEIIHYLQQTPACYDLAVGADVLPYCGELSALFMAIQKKLTPQGIFIFTYEISEEQPWQLQSSARFRHHPNYVNLMMSHVGLTSLYNEVVVGRTQDNQPVEVVLQACIKTDSSEREKQPPSLR